MDSKKLSDWLQVLGLFGVLAGLLFVGLQLQQDRAIAQANRIQIATDGLRVWTTLITDNAELWAKGIAGEPLSVEESIAFRAMARSREADLHAFWQSAVLTGQAEEVSNSIVREVAVEFTAYPGLLEFWREHTQRMRSLGRPGDYMDLVEAEMARVKDENSGR